MWFKRHLNWTFIFGLLAANVIAWLAGSIPYLFHPYTPEGVFYLVFYSVYLVLLLVLGSWTLRSKGRSLWNLLWLVFLSWLGLIIFLCLENKLKEGG